MKRCAYLLSLLLALQPGCRQVVNAVNVKQLSPQVVKCGEHPAGWYEYMPQYAPYFCLKTRYAIVFYDPEMQLGHWRLLHPLPPRRVMMEARGDTLILHRSFVWDGMSFGNTVPQQLLPSLLHDALYYALQGNAPFERYEADAAFLRACRANGCSGCYAAYVSVRTLGGFFGQPPGTIAPVVELTSPTTPPAPLEPDEA
ncbi:MAG: hypothetical protein IKA23_08730 [Akkermansia sp.]|nr:hypothetical protein [Akkermansia sp.]